MPNCIVKGCKNQTSRHKKQDGITFHTFPIRYQNIKEKWVAVIRDSRKDPSWQPSSRSVVCSEHFNSHDFYYTKKGLRRVVKIGYPKILPNIIEGSENVDLSKSPRVQDAAPDLSNELNLSQPSSSCALEADMDNYIKFKLVGGQLRLKKGVLPHKFECQTLSTNNIDRPVFKKRRTLRKKLNVPMDAHICHSCFELLSSEIAGNVRLFGHTMVCSTCGRSVRNSQHHAVERKNSMFQNLPKSHPAYYQATSGVDQQETSSGSGEKSRKRKKEEPPPPPPLYSESCETSELSVGGLAAVPSSRQSELCCCCLIAAGVEPLAGPGESGVTYVDMLDDCFHITYPEGLEPTASICSVCISTLKEGVRFKRRALHCQNTMIAQQSGDKTITIKKEPDNAVFEVQTVDATAHSDVLRERINFLEKIQEGYDLTGNDEGETNVDLENPIDANYHMEIPLFAEEPVDQSIILTESGHINTKELEFSQKACKCGEVCQNKFSRFEIAAFRKECEKYYSTAKCDINHMDIFLTGALACSYDVKSKIAFKFRGVTICEDFFMFVFVLKKYQYKNILKKIIERTSYRWTCQSLTDQTIAVKFLKSYSLQNSLILPGRFSNKHPDLHILPKKMTRKSMYCDYTMACVVMKKQFVSKALWDEIWECFCPYVVQKIPSYLCKVCREYVQSLSKFGLLSRGLKTEALQGCLKHLQLVSEETEYYDRVMKQPAIGDNTLHCSVDFLQRLRLPHEPTAGHLNLLDAYEVALFAVACQPPGETVVYVVPECVGGKSSNIILSLLNHFLESKCSSDVQCHCGPLLRADRVLQYAAWRGRASRCRLAFLPPGHDTAPDCLGLLKIALKDRPAQTVQDICEVLASIGVIPVPVANERGYLNIPIFNWLAFFDARNPSPVSNIQSYCHFEADSSNVGAVKCKVGVSSGSVDVQSVFQSGCLAGAPEVLPLPGLTLERHAYLCEKIRPHLDESVRDVLCPKEMQDPLEFKTEIKMEFEEQIA